jgi:hypothetical protein
MDKGEPVDVPVQRVKTGFAVYHGPVLVTKHAPAVLALSWTSLWCTTPVGNDTLRAVLPGGGSLSFAGFGRSPFCNGTPGAGPTPIMMQPFAPQRRRAAVTRSVFHSVRETWDAPRTAAAASETLHFSVTLRSKQKLVLDPCPDYTVAVFGAHQPGSQTFALNCSAVPFKDSRGRAYLPAGIPVRFAMEAQVGEPGVAKFLWELKTPDRTVLLGDALTIKAAASPRG